ncbi:hypothetical protein [Gordonia crocea]|uniref:Uncharacterized protein n=1 Tax=Gordonia crocea TaxID=589162 RepID=A0A7I9UXU6_9ACTN|nr:hypothetical protein [Gordonia crocea]GED98027.1 hypothetical protein nbrc107697_20660 [Gordonia crocea]
MSNTVTLGQLNNDWLKLKARAARGDITFEKYAAKAASDACQTYIDDITLISTNANEIKSIKGFGSFGSAISARGFYSEQAEKWVDQLQQCISIARDMQLAFQYAGRIITAEESEIATMIKQAGIK